MTVCFEVVPSRSPNGTRSTRSAPDDVRAGATPSLDGLVLEVPLVTRATFSLGTATR